MLLPEVFVFAYQIIVTFVISIIIVIFIIIIPIIICKVYVLA